MLSEAGKTGEQDDKRTPKYIMQNALELIHLAKKKRLTLLLEIVYVAQMQRLKPREL